MDVTGKKVYAQNTTTANNSVDISFLTDGVYLIEIQNGDYKITRKKLVLSR